MWQCNKCNYKNNNSSEKCHGNNCKAPRGYIPDNKKKVLDNCPKCNKETIFTFERNKMVEVDQITPGLDGMQNKRVKTRVEKRFRCTECQSLCRQTGKSKTVPEQMLVVAE